ncbi:hypothetical protein LTR85_006482 [Meristemomyces frigidus]|nr:hypothetical protein LTR85_006482 [Meristemomyces frigidus]
MSATGLQSDAFADLRATLDRLTRLARKQNRDMKESLSAIKNNKITDAQTSSMEEATEQGPTEEASADQTALGQGHHLHLSKGKYDAIISVLASMSVAVQRWRHPLWTERERRQLDLLMCCTEALRMTLDVELGEEYEGVVGEIKEWSRKQNEEAELRRKEQGV